MGGLIDIGVNFTDKAFAKDLSTVINRAVENGVDRFIVTGTQLEELSQAINICEQHPNNCYFTVGIHPHYSKQWQQHYTDKLKQLAIHANAVAIGETGLDFNRNFSTPEQQLFAFEEQLKLAVELQMPVFLHEREAHEQQVKLLKKYNNELKGGVAHCFTGNERELMAYLELGLYIGITGWICDERRGQELQKLAPKIPLDRLLLETDAPYLLPRNLKPKPKSRRNEPAHLPHICEKVAEVLSISTQELIEQTRQNSEILFCLG